MNCKRFYPLLHVVETCHELDYILRLKFNDGAEGLVDLADQLYGEMFETAERSGQV